MYFDEDAGRVIRHSLIPVEIIEKASSGRRDEMVKIAIVNAVKAQRDSLRMMIEEMSETYLEDIGLLEYESGSELIHQKLDDLNIVLLDHDLPGICGAETAKILRKNDKDLIIIFVTAHNELWQCGYDVQAFYYLTRPVDTEKFQKIMVRAIRKIRVEKRPVTLRTTRGILVLYSDEIVSAQRCDSNYVLIKYTGRNGKIETDTAKYGLSEIESIFKAFGFIKPYIACLINPIHIKRTFMRGEGRFLETTAGDEFPIELLLKTKWIQPCLLPASV